MTTNNSETDDYVENLRKIYITLIAISFTLLSVVFLGSTSQLDRAVIQLGDIIEISDRGEYRSFSDMIVNDCYRYRNDILKDTSWKNMPINGVKLYSEANKFPSQVYKLPDLPIIFTENYRYILSKYNSLHFNVFSNYDFEFKTLSEFILVWDLLSKSEDIIYADKPIGKAYLILSSKVPDEDLDNGLEMKNKITIIDSFSVSYCKSGLTESHINPLKAFYEYHNLLGNLGDTLSITSDSLYYKEVDFRFKENIGKQLGWEQETIPFALIIDTWKPNFKSELISEDNPEYQLLIPFKVFYESHNLQEQFIKDNRSIFSSKWRLGSFKETFPELYYNTNALKQGKPLKELYAELREESDEKNAEFSILGIQLPASAIGIAGPLVIFCIFLYYLVHLYHYINYISKIEVKSGISWIGLYKELSARMLTIFSSIILPCGTIIILVFSTNNYVFYRILIILIASLVSILAIRLFKKLWTRIDKS